MRDTQKPGAAQHAWTLLISGLLLILGGAYLAARVQTAGGISVRDIRFAGADGVTMSALLYVPPTATPEHPAPGVLAVHGYINSRETQSAFAIEYARRGYVVLAIDQTGHGYSSGAAFSNGFGGPDGLKYLRSLAYVDAKNIGLEGHSMGGWTVLAAAAAMPDAYRAVVLVGSTTGKPFAVEGSPVWPRNLAVVFSRYDEFSDLMWGVTKAEDIANSAKLQGVFGTDKPVVAGQSYGSVAQGTARWLATPETTHPGDHFSPSAVADTITWFAQTLDGGIARPVADQIWMWKEAGTGMALAGFVFLLLGSFAVLIEQPMFASMRATVQPVVAARDQRWRRNFWLTVLLPILSYFPIFVLVTLFIPANVVFPQTVTTQVALWIMFNAGVTWALSRHQPVAQFKIMWWPSLAIAAATMAIGYVALMLVDWFFTVDFRFWVVGLKLLNGHQFIITLRYFLPITLGFLIAQRALHSQLAVAGDGVLRQYLTAITAMTMGFALFLVADYTWFFATGWLPTSFDPLTTVIALQFLPLLCILAVIAVFTWRRSNSYLPGALISGLFVTWYVVAGTATQSG